jgi:hypothetical protein
MLQLVGRWPESLGLAMHPWLKIWILKENLNMDQLRLYNKYAISFYSLKKIGY